MKRFEEICLAAPAIQWKMDTEKKNLSPTCLHLCQQNSINSWTWPCQGEMICPGSVSSIRVLTAAHQSSSWLLLVFTVTVCWKNCIDSNLLTLWPCVSIPLIFRSVKWTDTPSHYFLSHLEGAFCQNNNKKKFLFIVLLNLPRHFVLCCNTIDVNGIIFSAAALKVLYESNGVLVFSYCWNFRKRLKLQ